MTVDFEKLRVLFEEAVEHHPPEDWNRFLIEKCGDDVALKQQVEQLLNAHRHGGSALDSPPAGIEVTELTAVTEQPGDTIGPYKLLQQIGEGGMGVVYMAEQSHPVERRVALKIIKPGMDTRQVIARFEAERQALAMMDHVNIARVLDAGATEAGRPYFVMELVHGVPITQYCDDNHLTPRQRLELFVPVCQAIQHAHQKGIIHRDIKPSNVMVTLYDGKPVPKVIDFGVAKATEQKLTERTLFTQYGTLVGTLEYMSPEQAEMSALGVDTRSDIYSLGVLLYELLTGSTPLSNKRVKESAYAEILRLIKEEEPPKPSTRLSESGQALASISAQRHTEPAKLSKLMRGELDWIVMKCLEKDRNRRYETANGFAADVLRYLSDEAVQACPPSAVYRFRKFARRNKGRLVTTSLLAIALLTAVGGVGWALRDRAAQRAEIVRERETREAEIAREQEQRLIRTRTQVELILTDVDRLMQEQNWDAALSTVRRAEAVVTSGEADAATVQRVRALLKDIEFLGRLEQIRMQRATWIEGKFDDAGAVREYAQAFRDYGVDVEESAIETSIDRLKARPALAVPLAAALDDWVHARRFAIKSDPDHWKRLIAVARGIDPEPLRDRLRTIWGKPATDVGDELGRLAELIDTPAQHPATLVSLARTLSRVGHSDSAIRLLRDAQSVYPEDFWLNFDVALQLDDQKDFEGAVRFYTAAVSIRPYAVAAVNNLGNALRHQEKLDESIAIFRKAIEIDPKFAYAYSSVGLVLCKQGKLSEAIASCRKAIEIDPKYANGHNILGIALHTHGEVEEALACFRTAVEIDPTLADAHSNLGNVLSEQNRPDDALACYRKAIELNPRHINAHLGLGIFFYDQNKLDEAIVWYRKVIELDPRQFNAHYGLGQAFAAQGKWDEAIACYRKSIETDPKSASAHYALAWELTACPNRQLRDPKQALVSARLAVQLAPENGTNCQGLGYAEYRAGNWKAAIAALEKVKELGSPGDSLEWFPLAMAQWQLGEQVAARKTYDQAVQWMQTNKPMDWFLRDLRAEAAELMGIEPTKD